MMRPTLHDVAHLARVSTATVSRVFSGAGRVRRETVDRVREAARELGYRPNRAARDLASTAPQSLGVVVNDLDAPLDRSVLRGVLAAASALGFGVSISERKSREGTDRVLALTRFVDAMILVAPDPAWSEPGMAGLPTVTTHGRIGRLPAVLTNEGRRLETAARHLAGLGHSRIAAVCDTEDREQIRAARRQGLEILEAREGSRELLRRIRSAGTTGLVAFSGSTARDLRTAWEAEGASAQRPVSLVAGDDPGPFESDLTVARADPEEVGATAVQLLRLALREKAQSAALRTVKLEPRLERGTSTGPPLLARS